MTMILKELLSNITPSLSSLLYRAFRRISHYVTHDAHHSQAHSQQRTTTQYDMLPQHPVNIKELYCECL